MPKSKRNEDLGFDILGSLESSLSGKNLSVIDFAEDERFCNKRLYPRQKLLLKLMFLEDLTRFEETLLDEWIYSKEVTIPPDVRQRVAWLKEHGYPHFREVVLVGGRRSSKGFLTGIAMAYKMYQVLQLQDPNAHYGIDANKEIYFTCVAASEKQAKELQYADFSSTVNSCAAMHKSVHKVQELEFSLHTEPDKAQLRNWRSEGKRVQRDIAKLRGRALPANARTLRGYTTMVACFDEFAHFMQGDSDQSDEEVFEATIPSLAQFGRDALVFVNSSPYSKVGKFYERWKSSQEIEADQPVNPQMLGIQFPSWGLFEDWWRSKTYDGNKFCVTVSPDWEPKKKKKDGSFFYTEQDREAIHVERAQEAQNPEKFKVERRAIFSEVIDSYLNPDMVDRMFAGMPLKDGTGYEPMNSNFNDSSYKFRYKAHLDPSSTTAGFGFAMGHLEDVEVDGISSPHLVLDFVKRWKPQDFPQGVINWEEILPEVFHVINLFRPYELTLDQFQSNLPIQMLRKKCQERGISEVRIYEKTATAHHNWNRAEVFKTALYQGVIHAPFDTEDAKYCAQELKFLQEINLGRIPRVDKQDVGPVQTKDMADCVMEVTESLLGNLISNESRAMLGDGMSPGAFGGFQIGGNNRDNSPFASIYNRRFGEQRLGGERKSSARGSNPARRNWGGPPVSRRLPGR